MTTKSARRNLRLRPADDELICEAAARAGLSVSEFLTRCAVERAHALLADENDFEVDDATWAAFTSMLDRPTPPDEGLREFLTRPGRLAR